ncbi:SPASM domain-containing protein [Methanocaldococcus infernus]|uniref:SPASM domain-containing protein n=1 Tax=Methanocaldococcus infernus TaxID=67760 RepID=UPI0001A811A7|nr:SPASM domain-containing protein [Methanocaldococcus infernus]
MTRIIRNKIKDYLENKLGKEKFYKYFYFLENSYFLKGKCNWGFYYCFITFDGLITPCCIRMEDKYALGDLKETNFENLWNNERFKKFREAHIKNKFLPVCEYCPD